MDTRDLKKYLAGFGVAGLLAGAGLMFGPGVNTASAAWSGSKGGAGVATKETTTESAAPASAPTPTGSGGAEERPAKRTPSGSWSGSK